MLQSFNSPSDNFIHRLINYYDFENKKIETTKIWTDLLVNFNNLHITLFNEDVESVREVLNNIYLSNSLWGIDWHQPHELIKDYNNILNKTIFNICKDLQIDISENITQDVLLKIEEKTGYSLDFPEFPNRPDIKYYGKNLTARYITCLQVVHHLNKHIKETPKQILEIGAGTGYITYLLGISYPKIKYHIIDLPLISIIHAYIYATRNGEDTICFVNEKEDPNKNLFIYGPNCYEPLLNQKIDLSINHNSFPEISKNYQQKYLELMKKTFTEKSFFFSLNWEPSSEIDQYHTCNACQDAGFKRIYREHFKGDGEWNWRQDFHPYYEEVFILN